jgi:alpha-ketoglutarate-dependent taurine dioxygenase
LSCTGEISAVAYNNRSIQPLRLPAAECRAYYAAYRRFAELLREPRFQLATRLENGDLALFDNQRVLHGRSGFASARHARHLQGCYVTRDSIYSKTALLRARVQRRSP